MWYTVVLALSPDPGSMLITHSPMHANAAPQPLRKMVIFYTPCKIDTKENESKNYKFVSSGEESQWDSAWYFACGHDLDLGWNEPRAGRYCGNVFGWLW
jgi:hypothetical protein